MIPRINWKQWLCKIWGVNEVRYMVSVKMANTCIFKVLRKRFQLVFFLFLREEAKTTPFPESSPSQPSLAWQGRVGEDPGKEVEEKRPTISRHRFSLNTGESIFCLRKFAVHS